MTEGVQNKVFETYRAAQAAIEAGVESFVLLSTDKAVHPTNVMGMTKCLAELGLQALAKEYPTYHKRYSLWCALVMCWARLVRLSHYSKSKSRWADL